MSNVYDFPSSNHSHVNSGNSKKIRDHLTDFYSIYPEIKRLSSELLVLDGSDENTCYSKRPFVNARIIAEKLNLQVREVPGKFIDNKHAVLIKEKGIILLNKSDNQGEQLFSIAHEIFHYIFWIDQLFLQNEKMALIAEKKRIWTKQLNNEELQDSKTLKKKLNNNYSERRFAAREFEEAFEKDIAIEDEIADYFAANLLIPIERFILWVNKPEKDIARAFRVVDKSIEKRKTEIVFELELLSPEKQISETEMGKEALVTNDMILEAGGHAIHDFMET